MLRVRREKSLNSVDVMWKLTPGMIGILHFQRIHIHVRNVNRADDGDAFFFTLFHNTEFLIIVLRGGTDMACQSRL